MNKELIRKFMEEAYVDGYKIDQHKFAELIVRECANISDRAEPYKAYDNILKHFGLES